MTASPTRHASSTSARRARGSAMGSPDAPADAAHRNRRAPVRQHDSVPHDLLSQRRPDLGRRDREHGQPRAATDHRHTREAIRDCASHWEALAWQQMHLDDVEHEMLPGLTESIPTASPGNDRRRRTGPLPAAAPGTLGTTGTLAGVASRTTNATCNGNPTDPSPPSSPAPGASVADDPHMSRMAPRPENNRSPAY